MRETIKTILYEWKARQLPELKERELDLQKYARAKPGKIIAVTGFRRVGKTYLILGLIKSLLAKKSREEVVYINFEDERIPLKTEFLTEIMPTAKEVFDKDISFLFLDEIQNIPGWSKWVRRIYDSNEHMRIFVSGSSSKMSSNEIPTELRGRFLEVKVFPLSFKEFLDFKGLFFDLKSARHVKEERGGILKALAEYLQYGGLPEIVLSKDNKLEIAQSYYQTVVRRDIIERNSVGNEEVLKAAILLLINSKKYSISKLYNSLKSMSYAIGKATLQNYISYIENSYFMFSTSIFSYKIKDQLQHPRKAYFIDNAFLSSLSSKQSLGKGRLYENLVAVELSKAFGKGLHYWKNQEQEEVDFVAVRDGIAVQLIQVCSDVNEPGTKQREIRSLLKASKELKCKELIIINEDRDSEEIAEWFGIRRKMRYLPLWKWLLMDDKMSMRLAK